MKTKWGSCNRDVPRLWLNLELARKHPDCLDYVVAHEMVHMIERHHGDRFRQLMRQHLPGWMAIAKQLDEYPLDAQEWAS